MPSDVLETLLHPSRLTRSKETALKQNLFTFRQCIAQFHADKGRYPASLQELRTEHYVRKIPIDPFTGSGDTWVVQSGALPNAGSCVVDVHSSSNARASDGTSYNTW